MFFELVINYVLAVLLPRLTNRLLAVVIFVGLPMLIATGLYFGDLTPGWSFSNFRGGGGRAVYSFFAGVAVYRIWQSGSFDWIKLPAPVALIILVAVTALALFLDKYYDQTARARMSRLFRRKQLTSNGNI